MPMLELSEKQRERLTRSMAEKLPTFDPRWDEKICDMWWDLFDRMWRTAETKPHQEREEIDYAC